MSRDLNGTKKRVQLIFFSNASVSHTRMYAHQLLDFLHVGLTPPSKGLYLLFLMVECNVT